MGGYDGSSWIRSGSILGVATENWTSTARGAKWVFYTTDNGSSTMSQRMELSPSGELTIGPFALTAEPTYRGDVRIARQQTAANASGGIEWFSSNFGSGYGHKISSIDSTGVHLVFASRENSATWSELARLNSSGLGVGTSSFGSSATKVVSVGTGTAPTTGPADTVQFYSSDDAAGHTIPSFYCEGTNVIATGQADSASSVRVKMRINGTVVTLLAV